MDDYVCVVLKSRPDESEAGFKARLSTLWTHMLREHPDDFEKVYAEACAFETRDACLTRKYLVEFDVIEKLQRQFQATGMDHEPIDGEDRYSKYEATPPDWFWIEH